MAVSMEAGDHAQEGLDMATQPSAWAPEIRIPVWADATQARKNRDDDYAEPEALCLELGYGLVRFLAWQLPSWRLAEEIAQDAFLVMWRKWPHIRNHENLRCYLYKVATHLAWDTAEERTCVFLRDDTPDHARGGQEDLPPGYHGRLAISEAVEKLPLRQRQTVWLFYFCGFHQDEIAEIMHIKRTTVAALLRQARCRLSGLLG
jgi:RNA polymerase sigma-70 factor, ECF subfamily